MSEKKYIGIDVDGLGITCEFRPNGTYKALHIDEVVALLNTPTPPPTGIVWRKPGEPGRESGERYMVWFADGAHTVWKWHKDAGNDGWSGSGVIAWAEINPPAWAGGAA